MRERILTGITRYSKETDSEAEKSGGEDEKECSGEKMGEYWGQIGIGEGRGGFWQSYWLSIFSSLILLISCYLLILITRGLESLFWLIQLLPQGVILAIPKASYTSAWIELTLIK